MKRKVVLAYSGGLDTSVILHWLKEKHGFEVICYVADVGQNEDLEKVKEKALRTGASKVIVEDLKEEFARDFIFFSVKANAVYEGGYLMGTSLARPLIAKGQIEAARREGAFGVAHGATGKGNDQVRFELSYTSLDPSFKVIAPWREWEFRSRSELIEYAKCHGIDVPVDEERPYSIDANLMHVSYEGGKLEDPWFEPEESMFRLTVSPERAPDRPEYVLLSFKDGMPTGLDGVELKPATLVEKLNEIGGRNGIGRVDVVENRFVGIKSRGVYETPGVTILHVAHRALESITMDREVMHLRDALIPKLSELIYYGFWFSPEMQALRAFVEETQKGITGEVRLKLYKGNCIVSGRRSERSLYARDFATFERDDVYDHRDASGFIRLNALRLKIRHGGSKGEV